MQNKSDALIAAVIEQIQDDVRTHQTDALFSLLMSVPANQLVAFLPQPKQVEFCG